MFSFFLKRRGNVFHRVFLSALVFVLTFALTLPPSFAQTLPQILNLPVPGTMLYLTPGYTPTIIRGVVIDETNPLRFDFIVDPADSHLEGDAFKEESRKLIKYFLAALTVPESEMWVNLSPYEGDRIATESFGQTEMGRDLLAQDYILKQLTASLVYPEDELGQKFWDRVYARAEKEFGTRDIPIDAFNKVWIVPEHALVYEKDNMAFVVEQHLKVMLETDYLAIEEDRRGKMEDGKTNQSSILDSHPSSPVNPPSSKITNQQDQSDFLSTMTSDVVREILIPELEREVNEGKNFANLRQIYNSSILAAWYKKTYFNGLMAQVYFDQNKVKGVDVADKDVKQKIYKQYVEAFKKGVYDYIKEDYDASSEQIRARKYISGGATILGTSAATTVTDDDAAAASVARRTTPRARRVESLNVEDPVGAQAAEDVADDVEEEEEEEGEEIIEQVLDMLEDAESNLAADGFDQVEVSLDENNIFIKVVTTSNDDYDKLLNAFNMLREELGELTGVLTGVESIVSGETQTTTLNVATGKYIRTDKVKIRYLIGPKVDPSEQIIDDTQEEFGEVDYSVRVLKSDSEPGQFIISFLGRSVNFTLSRNPTETVGEVFELIRESLENANFIGVMSFKEVERDRGFRSLFLTRTKSVRVLDEERLNLGIVPYILKNLSIEAEGAEEESPEVIIAVQTIERLLDANTVSEDELREALEIIAGTEGRNAPAKNRAGTAFSTAIVRHQINERGDLAEALRKLGAEFKLPKLCSSCVVADPETGADHLIAKVEEVESHSDFTTDSQIITEAFRNLGLVVGDAMGEPGWDEGEYRTRFARVIERVQQKTKVYDDKQLWLMVIAQLERLLDDQLQYLTTNKVIPARTVQHLSARIREEKIFVAVDPEDANERWIDRALPTKVFDPEMFVEIEFDQENLNGLHSLKNKNPLAIVAISVENYEQASEAIQVQADVLFVSGDLNSSDIDRLREAVLEQKRDILIIKDITARRNKKFRKLSEIDKEIKIVEKSGFDGIRILPTKEDEQGWEAQELLDFYLTFMQKKSDYSELLFGIGRVELENIEQILRELKSDLDFLSSRVEDGTSEHIRNLEEIMDTVFPMSEIRLKGSLSEILGSEIVLRGANLGSMLESLQNRVWSTGRNIQILKRDASRVSIMSSVHVYLNGEMVSDVNLDDELGEEVELQVVSTIVGGTGTEEEEVRRRADAQSDKVIGTTTINYIVRLGGNNFNNTRLFNLVTVRKAEGKPGSFTVSFGSTRLSFEILRKPDENSSEVLALITKYLDDVHFFIDQDEMAGGEIGNGGFDDRIIDMLRLSLQIEAEGEDSSYERDMQGGSVLSEVLEFFTKHTGLSGDAVVDDHFSDSRQAVALATNEKVYIFSITERRFVSEITAEDVRVGLGGEESNKKIVGVYFVEGSEDTVDVIFEDEVEKATAPVPARMIKEEFRRIRDYAEKNGLNFKVIKNNENVSIVFSDVRASRRRADGKLRNFLRGSKELFQILGFTARIVSEFEPFTDVIPDGKDKKDETVTVSLRINDPDGRLDDFVDAPGTLPMYPADDMEWMEGGDVASGRWQRLHAQQGDRPETPGGIDLSSGLLKLQIKRDGRGVPLPLNMQPFEQMNIEGFYPVIINIVPVNMPLLLGLADTADDETDSAFDLDPFDRKARFEELSSVN